MPLSINLSNWKKSGVEVRIKRPIYVVFFRFVYEGGEVILEKQDDEWTIVSGKLTWIE